MKAWYIEPPAYCIPHPLPMVYWTPFIWCIKLPTHGILNLILIALWTCSFGKNESVQFTMMGFKIPWRKFEPGSKYHIVYFTRGWFFRDSKYHVTPVSLTLPLTFWIISNLQIRLRLNVLVNLFQFWNTVKKNNKTSATYFWPGSDVQIEGIWFAVQLENGSVFRKQLTNGKWESFALFSS